jgi:integrase
MQTTNQSARMLQPGDAINPDTWPEVTRSLINRDGFHRLLRLADSEWKGILMLGRYCGLHLKDCVRLRRFNVSSDRSALRFGSGPTGRMRRLHLGPRLISYLQTLSLESSDSPLFPIARDKNAKQMKRELKILMTKAAPGNTKSPCFASIYFEMLPKGVRLAL